jgi:A/G-specific adenine glycosylase
MLVTARHISTSLNGCFPDTAAEIARLKGIGPYTAAAIASFAFNEPVAVVDGNVYRVLSRYLCIDTPCDTTAGKKEFTALARRYLATGSSAAYNQAIMDLGATVCTPRAPKCTACPVSDGCMALKKGTAQLLPVKSKKIKVTTRYFNFIILRNKGRIWLQKRGAGDIWENLHQPYLVETNNATGSIDITSLLLQAGINVTNVQPAGTSSQRLTHRIIKAECYLADAPEIVPGGDWYPLAECSKLAFPKTVNDFLIQNNII